MAEDGDELNDSDDEDEPASPSSPGARGMGMAYESPTKSGTRMRAAMMDERADRETYNFNMRAADPGQNLPTASEQVRMRLKHRHGSCVTGWREDLDLRRVHKLGEADFYRALQTIGFAGDKRAAWLELGGGRNQITIADVDTEAAVLLSKFYHAFRDEVGKLPELLAQSDSLRIGKDQFLRRCKPLKRLKGDEAIDLEAVFKNLQTGNGYLTEADCDWLEDYCQRKKKTVPPEENGLDRSTVAAEAAQVRALNDFRTFLRHKYGSITKAWRKVLDDEQNGELSAEDFAEAAERTGYKGDVTDLWDALVGGESYAVKLEDLEPAAQEALQDLKMHCIEHFGSLELAFTNMHVARKPRITREEFTLLCREVHTKKNHHMLFEYLDEKGVGEILLSSVCEKTHRKVFSEKAREAASTRFEGLTAPEGKPSAVTLKQRAAKQCGANKRPPDSIPNARIELVKLLEDRYESPVRAWCQILDRKAKGKITQDEFLVGCAAVGYTGSQTLLLKEMGVKKDAMVRLKDVAPEAVEECKEFKTMSKSKLGGVIESFERSVPVKERKFGAKIEDPDFQSLCKTVGCKTPFKKIKSHFDPAGGGTLSTSSLRWFHETKSEEKALSNMLKNHTKQKKQIWREELASKALPHAKELHAKQDEVRQKGRESLAGKKDLKNEKERIITFLGRKIGSVAKAWRIALDPEDKGALSKQQFIEGLQNAGALKHEATPAEIERVENLFDDLVDEEIGTLSLGALDPLTPAALNEFKGRCYARFGNLELAFQEFDPEGTGVVSTATFKLILQHIKQTNGVFRLTEYLDPTDEGEIRLEKLDQEAAVAAQEAIDKRKDIAEQRARIQEKRAPHMKQTSKHIGVAVGVEARRGEREFGLGQKMLNEFKKKLLRKHGTLVRAWRKDIVTDGQKSIDFDEFSTAWEAAGVGGDPQAAWKAFGLDGNSLSLEEFDPGVGADFRELRARIVERYGSMDIAFEATDTDNSFEMDLNTFLALCYECQFRRNEKRLFEFLKEDGNEKVACGAIDQKAVERVQKVREKSAKQTQSAGTSTEDTGKDLVRSFRQLLDRRFSSIIRAWRALDREGQVLLGKAEFVKSIGATGYAGNPVLLWEAIVPTGAPKISLREFHPEVFRMLTVFRRHCVKKLKRLQAAFEEGEEEDPQPLELEREEFFALCKKIKCPKPWEALFMQLDVRGKGCISWDDVRFIEEQWDWTEETPSPIRGGAGTTKTIRSGHLSAPPRVEGVGPLGTSMRPRKVTLQNSISLPALGPEIRAKWNDRHDILDTSENKSTQLIHLMAYVQTQEQDKIKIRIKQNILDKPTHQWLEENMESV